MKIITKLIILSSLVAVSSASIVSYVVVKGQKEQERQIDITNTEEYYEMTNDRYTFRLNQSDLQFTISDGTKTWSSNSFDDGDTETTAARKILITDPVTINIIQPDGSDYQVSLFDRKHKSTTTATISSKTNYLTARISVLDGDRGNPALNASFNINYYLENDGLRISVTNITERESQFAIGSLTVYPGMGMSYLHHEGYYLIPDGSGALIDLSKQTIARSSLSLDTYGKDLGMGSDYARGLYTGEQLSMPMFASVDNEKSMITTLEGGAEYSVLNVRLAKVEDNYNEIFYRFKFREAVRQYYGLGDRDYNVTSSKTMNECEPNIYYHLYDEKLEYKDIAHKYQEYLVNKGVLADRRGKSTLRLEFLMADSKKALFGSELVKMTSTYFINDKINELSNLGNRFSVSLKGYTKGGFVESYPNAFPAEEKTGNYVALGKSLTDKGIDMNFNVDLLRAIKENSRTNAMNISQKQIATLDYVNNSSVGYYRVNPSTTSSLVQAYEPYINTYNGAGFDFSSIGFDLFSTYYHETNSRTTSMNKYIEALKNFTHKRSMRKPNAYMFPYFENYLDTPTSASGYLIETETIPFLQMVLSGYRSFYSFPINLNYLGEKQLLEFIDYNINPSFLLTEADTIALVDSPTSSYLFSSMYSSWEEQVRRSYEVIINTLKQVEGLLYLSREEIAPNIIKNTYEGKVIIINYSDSPYVYNAQTVAPMTSEVF